MQMSLEKIELFDYIFNQLDLFFPDTKIRRDSFKNSYEIALKRLDFCFRYVNINGYHKGNEVYFSHLHTDQYIQFLWFFANTIWKDGLDEKISSKLMNLIRIISGMFVSYKCPLPDIFIFYHAVGSVVGNADYSNFLVIFQNVTINTAKDEKGERAPKIGKAAFFASGAKLIGNKPIGDNVSIGVNALVYNKEIPSNHNVINVDGKNILMKRRNAISQAQKYFLVDVNKEYSFCKE